MQSPKSRYQGRFAPSPTGPLHFGSLVAAIASYCQSLRAGGGWLVRIDDIDPPREVIGATSEILNSLDQYGFPIDGEVHYQSQSLSQYASALDTLRADSALFACCCSRKQLAAINAGDKPGVYPGTCRQANLDEDGLALRFRVPDRNVEFVDQVYGRFGQDATREIGDFVVKRRDGLYSYQLANVVDDHCHAVTEVVRGADLLDNTPRQLLLIDALGYESPVYLHVPVATGADGSKLSKQNGATALPGSDILSTMWQAWCFLGQSKEAEYQTLSEFWQFAELAWDPARIPACEIPVS